MTHKEKLAVWANRREEIRCLRDFDSGLWTYKKLGKKYRISVERIRQIVNKIEKKR